MSWTKLQPLTGFVHCDCCPPRTDEMPLGTPLAIGFGSVAVTKGDVTVWQGDDEEVRLVDFEQQAKAAPDNDWRVTIHGPLYTAVYQRQGDGLWVLVERGEGFTTDERIEAAHNELEAHQRGEHTGPVSPLAQALHDWDYLERWEFDEKYGTAK